MPIPLETKRLCLRGFMDGDAGLFSRYRSDPEVARYQGWEAPYSLEKAVAFVKEMKVREPGEPGQWYQFAIVLKESGEMIGDCAFVRLGEDPTTAEIAFTLARDFQRRGYAQEAVACLIDYLFGEQGLRRIRADVDPDNAPSKRLLERLGIRHEGCFVESLWHKGRWASQDWYAILRSEWRSG